MESQKIHTLLQKYFEAETTLDEENELITYFNSGKVAEELEMYIPIFSGIKGLSGCTQPELEDDLMNYILESEHKEKLRYRWMWQIVTGVAASLILVILAVNFYSSDTTWKDTFTDPDQAYVEATKTLDFVAGKYNKAFAQLKPVSKIDEARSPMNSGLNTLQKGFDQLGELNEWNNNLKKE